MKEIVAVACLVCVASGSMANAQTPAPTAVFSSSRVSPDGRQIAVLRGPPREQEVFVISLDGTGLTQVTQPPGSKQLRGWTADGQILYSMFANDTARLFAVGRNGGAPKEVMHAWGRGIVPSPDGKQAVTLTGAGRGGSLTVFGADGRNPRQILPGDPATFNHVWSPDSKRLAYSRLDSAGNIAVWVISADGGGAKPVTNFGPSEGRAQVPAWSPDGRTIAFQVGSVDPADSKRHFGHIWLLDVATGRLTKLGEHTEPYLDEVPQWFPDGTRLSFQSNRTGTTEIWIMNTDGTGAQQVTGRP